MMYVFCSLYQLITLISAGIIYTIITVLMLIFLVCGPQEAMGLEVIYTLDYSTNPRYVLMILHCEFS